MIKLFRQSRQKLIMENNNLLDRKLVLPKLIGDTDRFLIISSFKNVIKPFSYVV